MDMSKKNVVLILADQLRKDSLGCYGNPVARTPHLDRLAAEGVRFNRCYTANPICMPSRLSIFTGMYPRNHGLWTNGIMLEHERRTVATELAEQGYQTASFGKIHFEPTGAEADTGSRESKSYWEQAGDDDQWNGPYWGFEHVELTIGHTSAVAHYGRWYRSKGGTPEMRRLHPATHAAGSGVRLMPPELHDSAFVAERTCEFIKKERDPDRPFFVVASFPDPHFPFDPPESYADKYSPDHIIEPVGGPEDLATRPAHYRHHHLGQWGRDGIRPDAEAKTVTEAQRNERIAYTYAMVELMDHSIGEILYTLEQENLMEETILVFLSDHGELLGDHGLWLKGPFFYEGLLSIPLLVAARGTVQPGVSDELISSIDVFPTLCELLDLPIPAYVDGISQREHLLDPSLALREHCLIEYRNGFGRNDCSTKALVTKEMKVVRYQTGECELTDLQKDPMESANVADDPAYRQVKQQMTERLLDELLATESKWPKQVSYA